MDNDYLNIGLKFHRLGLNIICLSDRITTNNFLDNNTLKAPSHATSNLNEKRQQINDLKLYPWQLATGLGVILGFNNLAAIDVDLSLNNDFLLELLEMLDLPADYPWVIASGSQTGFHILYYVEGRPPINHETEKYACNLKVFKFGQSETNAYFSDQNCRQFGKIEFKWGGNLVLPPSHHISGNLYRFFRAFPDEAPAQVSFEHVLRVKEKYCGEYADYSHLANGETLAIQDYFPKADEVDYCYETRRYDHSLIASITCTRIEGKSGMCLEQVTWFVLDKILNVIKRKTFNYFILIDGPSEKSIILTCSDIKSSLAERIVVNKRTAYLEFLFDLNHVKEVIFFNSTQMIQFTNNIRSSGLYISEKDDYLNPYAQEVKFTKKTEYSSNNEFENMCENSSIVTFQMYCEYLIINGATMNLLFGQSNNTSTTIYDDTETSEEPDV